MCGTVLGPVQLIKEEDDWLEHVLTKKAIYSHFRVAVGGKSVVPRQPPRADNDIEPVFFNNYCAFAKQLSA